ncbi:NADH dehydrogenase [Chlorella sorokiniana]|uniref:NADH:ubiquinone reductase (non-electrogenic) n=1 Tax=Chlorella sorokiniana TaxID=3076 RepID=A0A2P6TMQ3_CHLSO|nr:NADH dehydrogenase [Chlorella sorokiniana]|eukprot:PRW45623.1 NADH dehydrogenase [Chlorella sorokiniana]
MQAGAGSGAWHNTSCCIACCRVTAVNEDSIDLELKDATKQSLPFGTCIWAAGVGMHPLVAGLKEKLPAELQTSRRGLLVDEHLRVVGSQGTIYCLGDAAVTGATPQTALPPTAQVARQEGEYLAALFSKNKLALVEPSSDGSEEEEAADADLVPLPKRAKPFRYFHLGSLAYLGSHRGVMDLPFKTPFLKTLRGYLGAQTWRFLETYMQDRTAVMEPEAPPAPTLPAEGPTAARKTRVVVLGSGWGAVSFIKNLDPAAFGEGGGYELVLVSPRNYMLFTPLLPSAVGGVVSENSIVESIRTLMQGKGTYYEARASDIDPEKRVLTCKKEFCEVCAARKSQGGSLGSHDHSEEEHTFQLSYDILLCSVGAVNATFGIKGVQDHCFFLKSMEDAQQLRRHISKALEHAALPDVTPENRRKLLSFVVVGGGPTGVEVAAELYDLVKEDVARKFPSIAEDVSITLIDGMDSLLNSYHTEIQSYAGETFRHNGIHLRLGTRVTEVREGEVLVEHKDGGRDSVPFGTCVWATGIAMHPLVALLKERLPADVQTSRRGLLVDQHLRVRGSQGTIYCLGDAAVTGDSPATALPPTAQVARQEGQYLAALLSKQRLALVEPAAAGEAATGAQAAGEGGELVPLPRATKPFGYMHLGSLAYLGDSKGAMDLPIKTPFLKTLRGYLGAQAWRTLETLLQVSPRTRWLVAHDWVRASVFGRNLSDI